jgi:hypothetical protein
MKSPKFVCLITISFLVSRATLAADEPWSFRAGRGITLNERTTAALSLEITDVQNGGKSSAYPSIPETAVVETVRGDFVYTINGSSYLRIPVKLGARENGRVVVEDGLFEGDRVVKTGAYDLWIIELQAVNGGRGCADGH